MAEHQVEQVEQDVEEENLAVKYKPPAEKSVEELLNTDAEDESLRKYKESLGLTGGGPVIVDEKNPKQVIVTKLSLLVNGRPDDVLDLTNLEQKKSFVLKEGCQYRVKIDFYAQRQIVSGLKYVQTSYRKGLKVDNTAIMMGSFPPKKELQSYTAPVEEAPHGMLARGTYTVKSKFIDDDKKEHEKWEWELKIKKDWEN